ncbi:hypothetical protein [Mesorhizobium sp. GbtcB19]|uniref:hypothetical protein n=1 Tax=Mesorhizobium sp. GbtcB19 TaxID=2824764 RepID=UPI001C2FC14B|nr:hypothetical protein [Mesorhizobium sp. GbtcB19]
MFKASVAIVAVVFYPMTAMAEKWNNDPFIVAAMAAGANKVCDFEATGGARLTKRAKALIAKSRKSDPTRWKYEFEKWMPDKSECGDLMRDMEITHIYAPFYLLEVVPDHP